MKYSIIIVIIILILSLSIIYVYQNSRSTAVYSNNYSNYFKKLEVNKIKVMTYNIKHAEMIADDFTSLGKLLSEENIKILGLNEVDCLMLRSNFARQYQILAEKLNMNYIFAPTIRRGPGYYGNALLTVYPIKEVKNYFLPTNGSIEQRALLEARLNIPGWGDLLVMLTHLSLDYEQRIKELKWIQSYLDKIDLPFILMGDFNSELKTLAGYNSINKNTATYPADNPFLKLDHVFNGIPDSISLQESSLQTKFAVMSDHTPFSAQILLDN